MKNNLRDLILNVVGVLLLIISVGAILNAILNKNNGDIFWMCYISILIMGIGILKKSSFIVATQLSIITIPLIIWNIDFFHYLFFQNFLWGITNYFFTSEDIIQKIITLQHVFILPLAFYCLYLVKLKRKDFWIKKSLGCSFGFLDAQDSKQYIRNIDIVSFFQLILVYILGMIFTTQSENIDCIYHNCISSPNPPFYPFIWFIVGFTMILITSLAINKINVFHKT